MHLELPNGLNLQSLKDLIRFYAVNRGHNQRTENKKKTKHSF